MADLTLLDVLPPASEDIVVYAPDGEWTGSRLRARVDALTAQYDITPGTAIGRPLPNGGELIANLFAVWKAGGVYVPVNPRLTRTEIERIERDVLGREFERGVAVVSFTSGTTGAPKPVPLLHARVLEGIDQVLGTLRARPADPTKPPMPNLVPVSLGLWNGIYQVLFAFRTGAPVVLMDRFETHEFADLVKRFAIKSTVLPPAAMVMLSDDATIDELTPLKYVRSISAPLSPLQARRFRDRFGISVLNGYGQTELGGEVIGWSAADLKAFGDDKLGAVGRTHNGVEARTDDDTDELLIRIPGRFDDWHHTGDIARIDGDGFVWIDGRVSDMINRGGLKVHPGEIEEVLRLWPFLMDVAVVGAPDARLGEVPVAFVVERSPTDDVELETLCRAHVAPYKVPVRFVRVPALPRNENGKVVKTQLLELKDT